MRASEPQWTWQISQVQQLVGLQRRDIQRACYHGEGGAGILDPQDSSWGRRHYEIDDLAKLFVVRQYKKAGCSLPEIARLLDEQRQLGHDTPALLETQVMRLH